MGRVGKALLVLACIAYPFVLHFLIRNGGAGDTILLAAALPLLAAAAWGILRVLGKSWWPLVAGGLLAMVVVGMYGRHALAGLVAVDGLSHAAMNGLMLWFFGRTLLPGKEPLISQISRLVNGELKPEIALYTRRVTMAWCGFFAAQIAGSLMLYLFAPLAMWSLFINVLNLPLLLLMFVIEYAWRTLRYPHHARTPVMKVVEVYIRDIAATKKH